jgi:hypothetical protein
MALTPSQVCCRALVEQGRIHEVLRTKFNYEVRDLKVMHADPHYDPFPVSAQTMAETLADMTLWPLSTTRMYIRRAGFDALDFGTFELCDLFQSSALAVLPWDHPERFAEGDVVINDLDDDDTELGPALVFFHVPRGASQRALRALVFQYQHLG